MKDLGQMFNFYECQFSHALKIILIELQQKWQASHQSSLSFQATQLGYVSRLLSSQTWSYDCAAPKEMAWLINSLPPDSLLCSPSTH